MVGVGKGLEKAAQEKMLTAEGVEWSEEMETGHHAQSLGMFVTIQCHIKWY